MEEKQIDLNFDPSTVHEENIDLKGLEDLFEWASEMVSSNSSSFDLRKTRNKEIKVKRQVLGIIYQSADTKAKAKFTEEINYLQRRVIALQGIINEKTEDISTLKQIMIAQYFSLQRIPELEEKLCQLSATTCQKDEVEAERKNLMTALSKLKTERDYLEELLIANESENSRLASLLSDSRSQLQSLKSRKWWHNLLAFISRK